MTNSNGEDSEKTPHNQEESKKTAQNKRKRNRNRKKNAAKVENLVSKTFQAKLVADLSQSVNTTESQASLKTDIETATITTLKQVGKKIPSNNNQKESASNNISPKKVNCKQNPKPLLYKRETSPLKNESLTMVQPHALTLAEKSREKILAEREAKKLAKQQAKKKNKDSNAKPNPETCLTNPLPSEIVTNRDTLTSHEHDEEKCPKIRAKQEDKNALSALTISNTEMMAKITIARAQNSSIGKLNDRKPAITKAERRAIQESQRAAKAEVGINIKTTKPQNLTANEKKAATLPVEVVPIRSEKLPLTKSKKDCKVKLFNHLESFRKDSNLFVNNSHIHPIIVRLGEQYAKRTIVGSNARCISFLSALKTVIEDYETPAKKEFARSLETTIKNAVDHLHKCRPLAVSVCNAYKHIKHVLTQLPVEQPESELKEYLCRFVDTYIENQIGKAAQAISSSVQDKISNGDVILTFGCSSLINYIFEEAHRRHVDFRVIVVDSRPFSEGQELLRRLTAKEIPCTYVLINAVGFVMPEVTKILLGAHALLSNGYVMARTGTAQVALVASSFNVPVLVCCETHKFSERFQTDAIVYNELGNPDDLILSDKCRLMNWQTQNKLSPLNLNYDITPPELVTAVVTEVAILPCTSVPVILRIKPTEIGY